MRILKQRCIEIHLYNQTRVSDNYNNAISAKENVYLCAIMLTQSEKRVEKYKQPISIHKSQFNMIIIYVDIVFCQFLAFKYFLESLIDKNYVCALITGNQNKFGSITNPHLLSEITHKTNCQNKKKFQTAIKELGQSIIKIYQILVAQLRKTVCHLTL